MRVFEIIGDLNNHQQLLPRDEKIHKLLKESPLWFDGRSKLENWSPPEMMLMSPKKKVPDIWSVNSDAAFAAGPRAFPLIQEFFEMAGEVLPLPFKGETLQLLNVTVCEDCLNGDRCDWLLNNQGERLTVKNSHLPGAFQFLPAMFPESSIFKIPYGSAGRTLCWEEDDDPLCSFKAAVESHKLTGLKFREIWSG